MKTPKQILDEIYDLNYRSNYKTSYSEQFIIEVMIKFGKQSFEAGRDDKNQTEYLNMINWKYDTYDDYLKSIKNENH